MGFGFNPSSNQYTDFLINTAADFGKDWFKQKIQEESTKELLKKLSSDPKFAGLFGLGAQNTETVPSTIPDASKGMGGLMSIAQPPPEAMMSLPNGGFGDISGNPIATPAPVAQNVPLLAPPKTKNGVSPFMINPLKLAEGKLESMDNPYFIKPKEIPTIGTLGDISGKSAEQIQTDLQKSDPAYFNFLKNVNEGKINVSGRSTQAMTKIFEDAGMVFPNFDASIAPARFKTRQDFTSGKSANNIKSLNTAVEHLNEMNNLIPKLDNSKIRKYNLVKNYLASETGNPNIVKFKLVKQALTGELANIFKNSGATDIEIANINQAIDSSNSSEQLKGVIQQAVGLMAGRLGALQDQWQNAFGTDSTFPVISKRSEKILNNIGMGDYMNKNDGTTNTPSYSLNDLQAEYLRRQKAGLIQ